MVFLKKAWLYDGLESEREHHKVCKLIFLFSNNTFFSSNYGD